MKQCSSRVLGVTSGSNVAMKSFAVFAALLFAASAQAETYTLDNDADTENNVGSASAPVDWVLTTNWSPNSLPSGEDTIQWATPKTGSHRQAYIALNGDYTVGSLIQKYRTLHLYKDSTTSAEMVSLTFVTQLGGDGYQQSHELNTGVKLVLSPSSTFVCSAGDHTWTGLDIKTGAEADIYGAIQSRVMKLEVNGGTLMFDPVSYAIHGWGRSGDDHDEINIASGTASFPHGIAMTGTAATPNNQINQSGGEVTFGGNFTSEMPWTYTWSGGTLAATDNVTFGSNVALTIPASAAVTLDVAEGKMFSAPNLTADSSAAITKTGAGVFAFSPIDAPVTVTAGGVGLATAGTYNFENVTFASGSKIVLATMGATLNAYNVTLNDATFEADLSAVGASTVVLNSSSADLLAKAKDDLERTGSLPAGLVLTVSGATLLVEVPSAYNFTGKGSIVDAECWGGTLPPNGAEVAISGEGVEATLPTGATFPSWQSIEVKNGAKLRIETDATLPLVILSLDSTLEIATGVTVTLSDEANLVCNASAALLPVLSVETGAVLNVPGGMKFSNVNLSLAGTVAATAPGGITFGYAAAGATTYFGLSSNGGTISIDPGSGDYNTSNLQFCCPEAGGAVNAVGNLSLASTTILPVYERSGKTYNLSVNHQIGFYVGVNNPASIPFELVLDNTEWGAMGSFFVKGGATFRLANGGAYKNFESIGYWGRKAEVAENGRIVVGSGCEFRMNALGDYGSNKLEFNPATTGYQPVVVEDGGVFENYRSAGNGKAMFSAADCAYTIYIPSLYNEHEHSDHTITIYDTKNLPFEGFGSVGVAEGKTLTFSTRNKVFWDDGQFGDDSGDRVVSLANVPITGGGSIALDNANKNVFGVVVTCGANTATGTASVVAPGEGEGATTLYFASGANWAGKVVAGNIALTNLEDAEAPVTVTFGELDLNGENFPLRVWKTDGKIAKYDTLNVDTYTSNGGKLEPVLVGDGDFALGDKIVVGKIKKGGTLPALKGTWLVATEDIDGDDEYQLLTLTRGRGLTVILR